MKYVCIQWVTPDLLIMPSPSLFSLDQSTAYVDRLVFECF